MQIAFSRFKDFLKEQYPLYECNIKPEFITKDMMVLFVDFLLPRQRYGIANSPQTEPSYP